MRGGVLILLAAIILAYLGVSGKYKCFTGFVKCLANGSDCNCNDASAIPSKYDATDKVGTSPNIAISLPKLPKIPSIPIVTNIYGRNS